MSKERLEELLKESPFNQHTEEFLIKLEDMNEITKIVEELEEVLLELVKQNEELCKSIAFYSSESYNAHLERLLDRREQQNQRLKQVLEFYANEKNYERAYDDEVLFDYLPSEIDLDNGEKARKELGKEA